MKTTSHSHFGYETHLQYWLTDYSCLPVFFSDRELVTIPSQTKKGWQALTSWNGWVGAMLQVDLTAMSVRREVLAEGFAHKYIGGSGFGVRILYDEVPPGDNALEPENVIVIGQGLLSGTPTPAGRFVLVSKSPLTGIYARTNGGGFFGPELKFAGYDLIIIRGKAEKPVYLWIDDERAEIRDATHLWGKDTWTTERMIRDELGSYSIQTLKIGPAGENICYSACVIGNLSHAASRCAVGAVWGSKRLKAIAVRGTRGVKVAKPREFTELSVALTERAKGDPLYRLHTKDGTLSVVSDPVITTGQLGECGVATLHSSYFAPLKEKNLACFGCSLHCGQSHSVKSGKYRGTTGEKIEGLTIAQGMQLRVKDLAFMCKYNEICNRLGMATEVGSGLAWAMELYQDGIITKEDADGLELTWGNEDVILQFLHKIAYKEGFGEVIDAYPVRAAQMLGRGSDLYIEHVKGSGNYPKGTDMGRSIHNALRYGVATRGRDHLTGGPATLGSGRYKEFPDSLLETLGKERYGDLDLFLKTFSPNTKGALALYDSESVCALCDMTGICKLASEFYFFVEGIGMKDFVHLLSAGTGVDFSVADLAEATERGVLLERAFNAREGIRRVDDYPYPFHYQLKHGEQHPRYDYSKFSFSMNDYDQMLDAYYELRGCDQRTGIPTRERLCAVGLDDVAEDLAVRGILPQ